MFMRHVWYTVKNMVKHNKDSGQEEEKMKQVGQDLWN